MGPGENAEEGEGTGFAGASSSQQFAPPTGKNDGIAAQGGLCEGIKAVDQVSVDPDTEDYDTKAPEDRKLNKCLRTSNHVIV